MVRQKKKRSNTLNMTRSVWSDNATHLTYVPRLVCSIRSRVKYFNIACQSCVAV